MEAQWRRAAAYAICRDDAGRLLLTRFLSEGNPDSGKWTMPGGGMEWGESSAETARRELEEEAGLDAAIGGVVGVYSRWFGASETPRGEPGHVVGIVHEATTLTGQLRTEWADGTTDGAGWFDLDQVRALPHVELVEFVIGLIDPR